MISLLLDTNLLIGKPDLSVLGVPMEEIETCTSILCYAELMDGEFDSDALTAARAVIEMAGARETLGDGLPFGASELAAYRAVCTATVRGGRSLTRARRMDMMIAATALANGLTLATRNADDFAAVKDVVPVVAL